MRRQNSKHGSKNYPRSLKCYFSPEMPNNGIEKLLFSKELLRNDIFLEKIGYDCFCSVYKPPGAYTRAHFILANDWAVLYSSGTYTRAGLIHETLQYPIWDAEHPIWDAE